jgi:hypothetical protein
LERVVGALIYTMRTAVLDVLFFSLMVVALLGIIGHTLFGLDPSRGRVYYDWHTFGESILTIWVYVCGDTWLPYQDRLRIGGYAGSEYWSLILIIMGNLMITNLFIGVISQVKDI